MEENLIQIYQLEVVCGYTKANVDRLLQVVLQNASKKLTSDPSASHYEDSYCPDSAIVDRIVSDMQEVYPKGRLSLINKWGHIHEKNMSTNTHSHGVDVSAVTYLSAPKGSGLIHFSPNPLHDYYCSIAPKKGMFLIFPGWIPHSVSRNLSNEKRVSISFNFKLNLEEA
tara:strand:- start:42 stop:548 length:507 start_codon:yes stop_codon:yes gene_type:complete